MPKGIKGSGPSKTATGTGTGTGKLGRPPGNGRAPYGAKTAAAKTSGLNWTTLQPKIETALKQNNTQLMTTFKGIVTKAMATS
jgi:hypothetical protein